MSFFIWIARKCWARCILNYPFGNTPQPHFLKSFPAMGSDNYQISFFITSILDYGINNIPPENFTLTTGKNFTVLLDKFLHLFFDIIRHFGRICSKRRALVGSITMRRFDNIGEFQTSAKLLAKSTQRNQLIARYARENQLVR